MWPTYRRVLAMLRENEKSFEDMTALFHVTSRERVRQIVDEFYPGERPHESRRCRDGKNCVRLRLKHRKARLTRAEKKFRRDDELYKLVAKHCAKAKLSLELVWGPKVPSHRMYMIAGELWFMLHITTASCAREGERYTAKTRDFSRSKVRSCVKLGVVVDTQEPITISRMYGIGAQKFLKKNLAYVLIQLTEKVSNGGRPPTIRWEDHLISTLE